MGNVTFYDRCTFTEVIAKLKPEQWRRNESEGGEQIQRVWKSPSGVQGQIPS